MTGNADHLPVSSADVSSAWSHTCTHGMHSWRWLNKLQGGGLHLANC